MKKPGSRLSEIAKKQKENTRNFLDQLLDSGDTQASEMIKIKEAWDEAKKTKRIPLWKFALDWE